MAKILINDGIHPSGAQLLIDAGHTVHQDKIEQGDLPEKLPAYDGICVRSATKVRADLIDLCPNLKFIGRGGVGLDNIDVDHAKSKGIAVLNTPAASSRSVAELAFAHMLSIARKLYVSNRQMPARGNEEFKSLKKSYSKGLELQGKKIGIIGMGRIGQETAKIALAMGMEVLGVARSRRSIDLPLSIGDHDFEVGLDLIPMDEMLPQADFITLHIPYMGQAVLGSEEFAKMKDGVILANAARGGTVDEDALLAALQSGKVAGVGLDVFTDEPSPRADLLTHPHISLTPHIGGSTQEAQEKIGIELAEKILEVLG